MTYHCKKCGYLAWSYNDLAKSGSDSVNATKQELCLDCYRKNKLKLY